MSDPLLALLIRARVEGMDPLELGQSLSQEVRRVYPTPAAVAEAVALGNILAMVVILESPFLDDQTRSALATRGLQAWNNNPLEHQTSALMLQVLLENGANANLVIDRGDTVVERLGERLGTIEGNEARALEKGTLRQPTLASQILSECWDTMERAGVDMAEARRVRNMASEPAGLIPTYPWGNPLRFI